MHCKPAAHCMLSLFTQAPPAGTLEGIQTPMETPGMIRQIPEIQSVFSRQSPPFALLATHLKSWQRICVAAQSVFVTHSTHLLLVIIMLTVEFPPPPGAPAGTGLHLAGARHSESFIHSALTFLICWHLPSVTLQNDTFGSQSRDVTHITHLPCLLHFLDWHW